MNSLRLKFLFLSILMISLVVLALPEFSFKIGDREFTYPSVGFSRIGLGVDFASFTKGEEIFSSERFVGVVTLDETIDLNAKSEIGQNIVSQIRNRINIAKLNGIDVQYSIVENNLNILIDIPSNYENKSIYAEFLTKQGDIEFYAIAISQPDANRIILEDYNITKVGISNIVDINDQRFRVKNLVLTVENDKITEIRQIQALLSGGAGQEEISSRAGINIDGVQTLDLIPDQTNASILRGVINSIEVPFDYDPNGKLNTDLLRITQSYFLEEDSIDQEINLNAQTENISPRFNPEGATFISWMLIFSMVIVIVYILNKNGISRGLDLALLTAFLMIFSIVIAKLLIAPISYGLILSFVLYFLYSIFIHKNILSTIDKEVYSTEKTSIRNTLATQFLLVILVNKFTGNSTFLIDFLGGLVVLSFVNYVLLYILIPTIHQKNFQRFTYLDLIKNKK